jgi:hypothetical protein
MKQFQKYGVAAAVASVATGVVATEVSKTESGDLAIIPYYTVLDGKNTGMHIINTTDATQVVKVRLRRGADSKDALDFNLVMSPRDEWTANIGANPNGDGVVVTTNDTTCTVPAFPEGGAVMPSTYAEGAEEGYVEIIGMAQPTTELASLPVFAEHDEGVPLSCALVREHFYRVAVGNVYAAAGDSEVRGTHTSLATSGGYCAVTAAARTGNACYITGVAAENAADALNLTFFGDADDNALKVSWMITDADGGLEVGDNAVMVSGFAGAPMMTNQQPLNFGTAGKLQYDPLNFELPDLAYGAWPSSNALRQAHSDATILSGEHFDLLREALDADAVVNDWAAFDTDTGTVATDWVVTLPGQYVMNNRICDAYDSYDSAGTACRKATTTLPGYSTATALDQDELPLILAANTSNDLTGENSRLLLWDREETPLNGQDPEVETDLGFSPGGNAGDPTVAAYLKREVNVLTFNDGDVLGSAESQEEDLGLMVNVTVEGADRGWAELTIDSTNPSPEIWFAANPGADDDDIDPNVDEGDANSWGNFRPVDDDRFTAVIGFAAWERSFADQAGNYGRAIEHSTISSEGRM